jgi:hypothetical protein
MSKVIIISVLMVLLSVCAQGRSEMSELIVHKAENNDPNPGPIGEKPYEMEGRKEERIPLIDFKDVSGWLVEGSNAEGWLYLTQTETLS